MSRSSLSVLFAVFAAILSTLAPACAGEEGSVDWDKIKDGAKESGNAIMHGLRKAKSAVVRGAEKTGDALGDGYEATKDFVTDKDGKTSDSIAHGYEVSKDYVADKYEGAKEYVRGDGKQQQPPPATPPTPAAPPTPTAPPAPATPPTPVPVQ